MRRPVIGIMGAGKPTPRHARNARALGKLCAEQGWVVLTGGRDTGVMREASAGAKEVPGSLVIGVLPGDDDAAAPGVDVAIVTGIGFARNNVNVLSSAVVVACGVEGPGTASEVALAIKNDRPVVLLGAARTAVEFFTPLAPALVHVATDPEDAISIIRDLLGARGA